MDAKMTGFERQMRLLEQLAESTGDYYFYYDCTAGRAWFSKNGRQAFEAFSSGELSCTVREWSAVVEPADLPKLQKTWQEMMQGGQESFNINYRVKYRCGQTGWINSRCRCYLDEAGRPAYVLGRVSERPVLARTMDGYHQAALVRELGRLCTGSQTGFLLMLGIDDMRRINLKHGREYGDAVIRSLAEAMAKNVKNVHQIFRVNGDCFGVILLGYAREEVEALFVLLQRSAGERYTFSGGAVSLVDYQVPRPALLIQYAESSLAAAKEIGKNQLCFFSPEDYQRKLAALELQEELEAAVKAEFAGFSLLYQAQVCSESYDLFGAEALLRFCSPRRGPVNPAEFIPILEHSGLIYPVGLWVIEQALEQCRQWRRILPDFHVSVNMSYVQLANAEIEADVREAVRNSRLPGSALTIEVTESMELLNYPHLNEIFRSWKKEGIKLSVDDFGTGYSSLSRLKEMEVDEIKIDRCFVSGIQASSYNYRLIGNMISLADSCGIQICCEGVEKPEELAALEELHPTLYQGFFFSRPSLPEEFAALFRDWKDRVRRAGISRTLCPKMETQPAPMGEEEIARAILEADDDVIYLSDRETYEVYYLNAAGQRLFGVRDYQGRKCYKLLHGLDAPCDFCTNSLLRRSSFYIWEHRNSYCGRHFLLKDKIISFNGREVRLEVATDITKSERVSKATLERLEFANRIVEYLQTLSTQKNYSQAVQQVLASVGQFYQADRAYLFERSPLQPGSWDNTYEWCAKHVNPQKEELQEVPAGVVQRWMERFEQGESVILYNLDSIRDSSPLEWEVLEKQNIQRLIAVPLREEGQTVGFIGVDNPRYAIHDDTQVWVLAKFLVSRARQERDQQRCQILMTENNQDIIQALGIGFWSVDRGPEGGYRLVPNTLMQKMLAIPQGMRWETVYQFWHSRICPEDARKVGRALEQMGGSTERAVQVVYRWQHPGEGQIWLRFTGIGFGIDRPGEWRIKGYCRRIGGPEAED